MRKSKADPRVLDHLEWLGFVKPIGLVVSAPALVRAGAILNQRDTNGQCALRELIEQQSLGHTLVSEDVILDFQAFAREVLGWGFSARGFAGTEESPIPEELSTQLGEGGEIISPDFAVREFEPKEGATSWQLVVQVLEPRTDFDKVIVSKGQLELSPQGRMEKLLRQTSVSAGLLFNGKTLRLISAPRGESSGWLDFSIADMASTAGRPICAAMRMLLSQERLLSLPKTKRLPALLEDSRKFQNEVSERLAEQVLEGLYEFLRGFQAAHDASKGELLKEVLEGDPDVVYRALLTVILRMVFLLYAEERGMLPGDDVFQKYYSVAGLHQRLREDAALNPDTMDQRFGAWAQLVVLFRMVYDGADYPGGKLPKRHGDLFDPERFPFLEGRNEKRETGKRFEVPLVPDGTIYRVLEKLLVLDGERLSYRALDVEQIGSVYETMMGFRVDTATGKSIAIRAEKRHGAPTTINLEALLAESSAKREKWLQENAGRKLSDSVKKGVKEAINLEGLHAALHKVVDQRATPDIVPPGSLILQPSEARRKSGSHYTPRSLTEPIVRTTFEPILNRLKEGDKPPKPEQILDLKVCDPAMGSGAFLVEACRQLAEALIESWQVHGGRPEIPADEDEVIFARRLVAQRCLYGVDKNPMAVDLAKVSLWLATLARDHAFTFLDHSFKCGDSLVGLDREQLAGLHWKKEQKKLADLELFERIAKAVKLRQEITLAGELDYDELDSKLTESESVSGELISFADALVSAFFKGKTPSDREAFRQDAAQWISTCLNPENHDYNVWERGRPIYEVEMFLRPFHWEFEYPEVFFRSNIGFDAIVGNPPFAGKNTTASSNPAGYPIWLQEIHSESHGNSDLVAHFFRRTFSLLRFNGVLGLISTNTIAQGDTRATGLRWICNNGGTLYHVNKRVKWPGLAAVIVSVIHLLRGSHTGHKIIDGRRVPQVTAFLFHRGGNNDPNQLRVNANTSFSGSIILGKGFTFDDDDPEATPIAEMERLIAANKSLEEVIYPFIGGEEVNTSPTHSSYRFVINFGDLPESSAKKYEEWWHIIESKVKPLRQRRDHSGEYVLRDPLPQRFWQYAEKRPGLYSAIESLQRVLVIAETSNTLAFTFLPSRMVFSNKLYVIACDTFASFAMLQCRLQDQWTRLLASTMKDDQTWRPSDCFENFPFVSNWQHDPNLEAVGRVYFEFRAEHMIRNNEGLTKTYNRFHDPEERDPDILRLRELHSEMDRAVLDAYGWTDISTHCEFILDYEDDEEEEGGSKRKKKKPWRYRWPDEVRDEVLARLLELNKQRYEEEVRLGLHTKSKAKSGKTKKSAEPEKPSFDFEGEEAE
jgi:hypothetical protein